MESTVIDNLSLRWQDVFYGNGEGPDLRLITGISVGDDRGELRILLTTGTIIYLEDVTQDDAIMWCDWLDEDIHDPDDDDYGEGWTNFNHDLVVAFDWVKYGSDVEHLF